MTLDLSMSTVIVISLPFKIVFRTSAPDINNSPTFSLLDATFAVPLYNGIDIKLFSSSFVTSAVVLNGDIL